MNDNPVDNDPPPVDKPVDEHPWADDNNLRQQLMAERFGNPTKERPKPTYKPPPKKPS